MKYQKVLFIISILGFFITTVPGCNYVAVRTYNPRPGYGPPPHAPASGYRQMYNGYDLQYDSDLGAYIVLGMTGVYFIDGRYYRHSNVGWYYSDRPDRNWRTYGKRNPPGRLYKILEDKNKRDRDQDRRYRDKDKRDRDNDRDRDRDRRDRDRDKQGRDNDRERDRDRGMAYGTGPVYGPPPHAPAAGYRQKYHGYDLQYDSALGAYIVLGMTGVYFIDGRYYRHSSAGWYYSDRPDRNWRTYGKRNPPGKLYKIHEDKNKRDRDQDKRDIDKDRQGRDNVRDRDRGRDRRNLD